MKKKLVLVESPTKISTIQKILKTLGREDFTVIGTAGHICNLEDNKMGVALKNDVFDATFKPMASKKKIIENIKKQMKYCDEIYICTDDDREGERIAEDLVVFCKIKEYFRITFTEITKSSIKKALIDKVGVRLIDQKTVKAQWTRRVIDRVIGYGLSFPLSKYFKDNNKLTYKEKDGTIKSFEPKGTGRILALALYIICKRQKDIIAYNDSGAVVTDIVIANYNYDGIGFMARGNKLEYKKEYENKRNEVIKKASFKIHRVYSRSIDIVPESPPNALTTLNLYTAVSYLYKLGSKQTEVIMKNLFETGYINYPRTDSLNLSTVAREVIIKYLLATLEDEEKKDVLMTPRVYKEKKGNAQNAHEAIRPSIFSDDETPIEEIISRHPDNIREEWAKNPQCKKFGNHHHLIYSLIWARAICTQLRSSEYDVSKITVKAGDYTFDAKSNNRLYDGWEKYEGNLVLNSTRGIGEEDFKRKRVVIPPTLAINTIIEDVDITFYESNSKSPKRISEGALINTLSGLNVARPSTLHTFASALESKGYIEILQTMLIPTDLGMEVNTVVESELEWLVDEKRAKNFEKTMEQIELGKIEDNHSIILEYWNLVNDFRRNVGYELLE
ncbi:DNA topoisomerase [Poseidonibacter ostreae]|uniref:DNA topoisomerase n=1 Tax=Poseidonibacter ostreae TaxID=2654171 RepID=A0A6L4WW62_9BACT|nr:DNA topoisomerase [Poseidonibacter ostreae]KAB7891302.1 hypothetical protein GBG19_00265 [Poseidonibacter ostreae]